MVLYSTTVRKISARSLGRQYPANTTDLSYYILPSRYRPTRQFRGRVLKFATEANRPPRRTPNDYWDSQITCFQ